MILQQEKLIKKYFNCHHVQLDQKTILDKLI
jgi:hypothetical protein